MRRVSFVTACLALLALLVPVSLLAQEEAVVEPGAKVRVMAPSFSSQWLVGTLVEMRADSWVLEVEGRDSLLALPLSSVSSLEVSRGQKTRALKGAVIGLVSGAGGGVLIGLLSDDGPGTYPAKDRALIAGVVFSVVGGLTGLGIGYGIKVDRWETVPLDRLRVSIVPQRDGRFAVGFSVRF